MADYDQLAAAQRANEQHANAIRETAAAIQDDINQTAYEYQRNISEGRGDMAAFYLRQYRALCDEAQKPARGKHAQRLVARQ